MKRKVLINLLLAVSLIIGTAAVAWQFFGPRLLSRFRPDAFRSESAIPSVAKDVYYCPMHKEYQSDRPGNCPICSMKLVKRETEVAADRGSSARAPAMTATKPARSRTTGTTNAILVSPEQQQLIGIRTAPAEMRAMSKEIRTVGKVGFDETKVTHIHSKVSGWIEQVFVDFVGKQINRGDPLFTVYSPDLVSTQEEFLLALRARKELASSSFEHVSRGAENLVEAARRRLALWDVTEGEIARLEKEGKARRDITVYSPVSGVVTERAAYHHGRYITPELDLYTIVDLSTIWVLGEVYEYELPLVRMGQRVEIEMPYAAASTLVRGIITYIYPYLNPNTRTSQIRVEFQNGNARLKPDMFVNLRLRVDLGHRLAVPEDAVLDTGTEQYVFVDLGEGYFEPRRVKLGPQGAGYYTIQEGLKPGEKVATAANFILDSESRLKGAFANMGAPSAPQARPEAVEKGLQITLRTEPEPAKVGDNLVRVRVADAKGAPLEDASVRVRIFMPAMGLMPPMSAEAELRHMKNGEYMGRLSIPMAWTWQTTVTVQRGGQRLGSAQFNVTAR
jgi:membrane fusion protein, copper/silver efflux system